MDATPLQSRISGVTVYLDRAKVTRTADIQLPAGESVLSIPNLPTTLSPESVRVKGRGAGVRIVSIDVPLIHLAQTPDTTAAQVLNQIETLELQNKEWADGLAVHEQRLKVASAVRTNASTDVVRGVAWGKSSLESLESLSAYADRQENATRGAMREIAAKQRALNREVEALKARLKQLMQPASVQRRTILITVEAADAGTGFAAEVSYTCSGATWSPLYDARLQGDNIDITYLAMITQSTGEDWNDIELALSTARPAVTTRIPELSPWFLSVYAPPALMSYAAASDASPARVMATGKHAVMMEASAPAPAAPAPPMAAPMQAEVEEHGASVTFRIPRRTSIPSDKTPHRAQIAEFGLPAKLDYITAPKIAEQAYLRATVRNDSSFVLLPGKANLFHGEEYVGVTHIKDTAAREFELQLGVDERVTVKRELVSRDVSKTFMGNVRKSSFAYRTRIAHRLERSAAITVLDQMPHSRHEEIKVKLNDAVPKPAEQTDLSELRWKASLEPGRELEITFGFTVEFPRNLNIQGLAD